MQSQSRLVFTLAFLSCGFIFAQPAPAQAALPATAPTEGEGSSDETDPREESGRRSSGSSRASRVTADGMQLPDPESDISTALVASFETDRLVIEGTEVKPVEYPALPEVEGTRINSGKKTSFVKPEEFPSIANNDYRELLATTPGLLVSEEPSSPIVNFGYRGLDSQRSEFMQVLKDGVSIKNEQFGFPESHYTPILDAVERVEFIRAGAALQFGPQPGGAVNFVMKMPRGDVPFEFETKNLFGTDGLYQNYTAVDGTVGQFGYYAYFDHRQRDGFRTNSDYDLNNGSVRLVYNLTNDSRLILTADLYDEEHGEPGGLTEVPTPGASLYQVDRNV
ncbi:MAG TPA: TonB-dependent receptor plug domain-containing protein [Chthoniobacterales bacterium]|jgi:Fe(3+) dicitrate transport protein|nr:TonB-dependent receptor plug domain-containing protein [Chthoniobacterales bacterium]